jgi:hypothetical protein
MSCALLMPVCVSVSEYTWLSLSQEFCMSTDKSGTRVAPLGSEAGAVDSVVTVNADDGNAEAVEAAVTATEKREAISMLSFYAL